MFPIDYHSQILLVLKNWSRIQNDIIAAELVKEGSLKLIIELQQLIRWQPGSGGRKLEFLEAASVEGERAKAKLI